MGGKGCDFARCQGSLGRGTPRGKGWSGPRGGWPRFPLHEEALRASGWLCVRQGARLESPRAGGGMHRVGDCFCVSGGRDPQRARARPARVLPHSPPEVKGHRAVAAAAIFPVTGARGRGPAGPEEGSGTALRRGGGRLSLRQPELAGGGRRGQGRRRQEAGRLGWRPLCTSRYCFQNTPARGIPQTADEAPPPERHTDGWPMESGARSPGLGGCQGLSRLY